MPFYVYLLHCADNSFYVGSTTDISRRITEHENGVDRKAYTFSRRPVSLAWVGEFQTHDEAFCFERQVKGWSHAKKAALVKEDWEAIHQIVREERTSRERWKNRNR